MLHYLDIETTGLHSDKDKVITIQFAKIDFVTGKMVQPAMILTEWASSEKDILEKAYGFLMDGDQWDFVPCGYNILHFDLPFLFSRFQTVLGKDVSYEFLNRPTLDLKSTFILMNGGRFKGSNRFIKKNGPTGKSVPQWYERKEYDKIEAYISMEADDFGEAFCELRNRLNMC